MTNKVINLMKIFAILMTLFSLSVNAGTSEKDFFENLKQLCGKTLIGKTLFPADPGDDFAGKKLVMQVTSCTDKEIRIPFNVGEDTSRTWIFTMMDNGLLFKHDHRYKDGKPHKLTMYGGMSDGKGSAFNQSFPADAQTHKLVPEGKTNVWNVSFDLKKMQFTYYLERHNKPRFKAVFENSK